MYLLSFFFLFVRTFQTPFHCKEKGSNTESLWTQRQNGVAVVAYSPPKRLVRIGEGVAGFYPRRYERKGALFSHNVAGVKHAGVVVAVGGDDGADLLGRRPWGGRIHAPSPNPPLVAPFIQGVLSMGVFSTVSLGPEQLSTYPLPGATQPGRNTETKKLLISRLVFGRMFLKKGDHKCPKSLLRIMSRKRQRFLTSAQQQMSG